MRIRDVMKTMTVACLLAAPVLVPYVAAQTTMPGTTPGQPVAGSTASVTMTTLTTQSILSGWRATKLMGMDVYDSSDKKIGSIDDLIITRDERVPVAVISVGGFLGIGAKLVAVPFRDLRLVGDDKLTLPGATMESLKALPEFAYRS
jgi:sporulation protein YlmC with PRC-barrel domain